MSAFDNLAKATVKATNAVFGESASWAGFTAKVGYQEGAGDAKLGDKHYGQDLITIEFRDNDFPGLKGKLDGHKKETVKVMVGGVWRTYTAITATAMSDGMLTKVTLRPKPNSL